MSDVWTVRLQGELLRSNGTFSHCIFKDIICELTSKRLLAVYGNQRCMDSVCESVCIWCVGGPSRGFDGCAIAGPPILICHTSSLMSICFCPFLLIAPLINGKMMRRGRLKATCGVATVAVKRLPRHVWWPLVRKANVCLAMIWQKLGGR